MGEPDIAVFGVWSSITIIVIVITGLFTGHTGERKMRHLHLEKHGLRGLAIAESFSQTSKKSVLSGIVMSTDLIIDGFVLGHSTVGWG